MPACKSLIVFMRTKLQLLQLDQCLIACDIAMVLPAGWWPQQHEATAVQLLRCLGTLCKQSLLNAKASAMTQPTRCSFLTLPTALLDSTQLLVFGCSSAAGGAVGCIAEVDVLAVQHKLMPAGLLLMRRKEVSSPRECCKPW